MITESDILKAAVGTHVFNALAGDVNLRQALASRLNAPVEPDTSKVICPQCCHQFTAISVDDQAKLAVVEEMRKAVAQIKGYPDTWPSHGNAPLAITAGVALDRTRIEKLREVLETAKNGLQWYRDTYPEADSGADDEMMAAIEEALK